MSITIYTKRKSVKTPSGQSLYEISQRDQNYLIQQIQQLQRLSDNLSNQHSAYWRLYKDATPDMPWGTPTKQETRRRRQSREDFLRGIIEKLNQRGSDMSQAQQDYLKQAWNPLIEFISSRYPEYGLTRIEFRDRSHKPGNPESFNNLFERRPGR